MDEENGSSAVTRRAPADYFVNHKVQVFPATESDVIYHSIYMDESTIPTFAPSPITNHACAREKKKKKVNTIGITMSTCDLNVGYLG